MKFSALLSLAVLATVASFSTADASTNGALRVTIHHHKAEATHADRVHHAAPVSVSASTSNTKKFAKLAHMKATPWETEPEVKASKCEDMCYLLGFYTYQEGRNCYSRPTDLCMQYKLGKVGLEAVLITAECECSDGDAESEDDDASGSGDETVEVPTTA